MTTWLMPWGQLAWLRALDDKLARRAFDNPGSYVIGGAVPGYGVTPIRNYTSFDAYARAYPALAGWVLYDLENWAQSPVIERQHPVAFMSAFASVAGGRGQSMIAAPSRDLVYAPSSDHGGILPGEDINAAYLRCGIAAAAAGAACLLVQSQGAQKDLPTFTNLISGAEAQQPPGQVLWGGLTTGGSATAAQMAAAYYAAPAQVTGWWVTIDGQAHARVAADFFREVLP